MSIILHTYDEILAAGWEKLVEQSPYATWFQTPEAYRFYSALPDEMMPFVVGVVESDTLTGVVVGYLTREKSRIKQYFTRRAIVIGGPLLDEHISAEALAKLLREVVKESGNPIYIETRNFHDYSSFRSVFEACGWEYQPHLNFHVDCNVSQEMLLKSMSESRRRQIRKALKNGVCIEEAKSEGEVRAFVTILRHLYKTKVKTPLFSERFFLEFFHKGYGKYLIVKQEGKVIGGMMCPILISANETNMVAPSTIYEWFICGDDLHYPHLYPSVVATYAAMNYAKEHHISRFDFMGAGKPDKVYTIRNFKAEFGGQQVEHGRYLQIMNSILYKIGCFGVKFLKFSHH